MRESDLKGGLPFDSFQSRRIVKAVLSHEAWSTVTLLCCHVRGHR